MSEKNLLGDDDGQTLERPPSKPRRRAYSARVFQIDEEEVVLGDKTLTFSIVTHPGAIIVVPQLTDGRLVLARQYRRALSADLYEFPAGTLEAGEEPIVCAKRELAEEVGYAAAEWHSLGIQYPVPGYCTEVQHCFFARNLEPASAEADEDELMLTVTATPSEVEAAIRAGTITDAKSIAIFFKAKLQGLL